MINRVSLFMHKLALSCFSSYTNYMGIFTDIYTCNCPAILINSSKKLFMKPLTNEHLGDQSLVSLALYQWYLSSLMLVATSF